MQREIGERVTSCQKLQNYIFNCPFIQIRFFITTKRLLTFQINIQKYKYDIQSYELPRSNKHSCKRPYIDSVTVDLWVVAKSIMRWLVNYYHSPRWKLCYLLYFCNVQMSYTTISKQKYDIHVNCISIRWT